MVLGFKTKANGKPTGFVEKIENGSKIHTLRADVNRRWRPGMPIQFATGVRSKQYTKFKEGICTAVQHVKIKHWSDGPFCGIYVFVDGDMLKQEQYEQFVKNDGFDSSLDFYEWFNSDFEGYLIHWTDKRY